MKKSLALINFCLLIITLFLSNNITYSQAPNISYPAGAKIYTGINGSAIAALNPTNTGGALTYGQVTTYAGSTEIGRAHV